MLIELLQAISAKRNSEEIAPDQPLSIQLNSTMLRQLLEQLRQHRCLLVLDNVEAVLASHELAGTYRPGYEEYRWLFQQLGAGRHQSSILLTSREVPAEVAIQEGTTALTRLLHLEPLSIQESETILAMKGLTFSATQPQVEKLIERYHGNPLVLGIVAKPLKELFDSNIATFLAQETLLFKDIRDLLTQQFDRLSWLEKQVMYWLAVNREAITAAQIQADLMPSVSWTDLRDALVSLGRRSLIETIKPNLTTSQSGDVSYTQQPIVMEYVTERLVEQVCQEVEQMQIDSFSSHALVTAFGPDGNVHSAGAEVVKSSHL